MKWIFTFMTFTSCSFLIVGDRTSESIRTSYVHTNEEMLQVFSYLEGNGIKLGGKEVCYTYGVDYNLLDIIGSDNYYINSKIKRGTFNDNEGLVLILDDSPTIDIPAIIECNVKYKNDKDVNYRNKAFVFYLVPYMIEGNVELERALSADKMDQRNKTVFILQEAQLIDEYRKTYGDRNARKFVDKWFDRATDNEEHGNKTCEQLSKFSLLNEKPGIAWDLMNGETIISVEKKIKKQNKKKKNEKRTINIKYGDYYVRISDSIEYKLIGIIKCVVKSKISSSSQNLTEKYFTVIYFNGKGELRNLFGPVNIDGKQVFKI